MCAIMTDFAHIVTAALVWMLLGNSLRFATVGAVSASPLILAGWNTIWAKGGDSGDKSTAFSHALDQLYTRLLSALTSGASAALVYVGIFCIGVGMVVRVSGSVVRYLGGEPMVWETWSQTQNVISAPMLVVGMSCIIAAVSRRRTASLIISAGFVLAGLGIGVVTASIHMP